MNYKPPVGSYVILSHQGLLNGLQPGANIRGLVVDRDPEHFLECVSVQWPGNHSPRPYHIHYLQQVGDHSTAERIAHKARTQELVL